MNEWIIQAIPHAAIRELLLLYISKKCSGIRDLLRI